MSEITKPERNELSLLDNLAAEARVYSESLAMNMFQLGRVFTEAKQLVRHGEWQDWLRTNSGMSERSAQQFMAIYGRFGEKPAFAALDKTKLFKMLSLPSGAEEEFAQANDLQDMTSREVEEAVKRVREEMQGDIDKERAARVEAERSARILMEQGAPIPPEIQESVKAAQAQAVTYKEEAERADELARALMEEKSRLAAENKRIMQDLDDTNDMLSQQQGEYDRLQNELLNAQSAVAKGDAERVVGGEMTLDAFSSAVRQFIGAVSRMPHMGPQFAAMSHGERQEYETLLCTVESWAQGAREAINTVEGGMIYDGQ